VGGRAGPQAGIYRVRLGLGKIEGRDRERYRDIEIKRHRDRADNKNPEQSQVAQLVFHKLFYIFHTFSNTFITITVTLGILN
jgi:hypothetical protein